MAKASTKLKPKVNIYVKLIPGKLAQVRGDMRQQSAVARRLGIPRAYLNFWETGRFRIPASELLKLSDFYDVKPAALIAPEDLDVLKALASN